MTLLYQVFVCKTHVVPLPNSENIPNFRNMLKKKTSRPKIKVKMLNGGKNVKKFIYQQRYFDIMKTGQLVARKY